MALTLVLGQLPHLDPPLTVGRDRLRHLIQGKLNRRVRYWEAHQRQAELMEHVQGRVVGVQAEIQPERQASDPPGRALAGPTVAAARRQAFPALYLPP
jgi:hypothetical protein